MVRNLSPPLVWVYHRARTPEVRSYKLCDVGLLEEVAEQVVTRSRAAAQAVAAPAAPAPKARGRPKGKAKAKGSAAASSERGGPLTRLRARLAR